MESVNLDYNRFVIQQITLPKPIQPLCFTFHGFIKVSKRICNIFSGKIMTYGSGKSGPGLVQAHKCGRAKTVNGTHTLFFDNWISNCIMRPGNTVSTASLILVIFVFDNQSIFYPIMQFLLFSSLKHIYIYIVLVEFGFIV
jgi:hypothetical protein